MADECIHGMVPEWCANCKKLLTPEEEEVKDNIAIEEMAKRWTQL